MSAIGGTMDDGNTASIPGIQGSDINDGDIIGATAQESCGGDLMKYTMMLPSGRKLETSPFQQEHKRKMMIQWCDAVRQAIVDDATAAYETKMRAAREEQMEKQSLDLKATDRGGYTPPSMVEDPNVPAKAPQAVPSEHGHDRVVSSDPVALARSQLVRAHIDADHFANVEVEAGQKKAAALKAAAKWTQVLSVLNAD